MNWAQEKGGKLAGPETVRVAFQDALVCYMYMLLRLVWSLRMKAPWGAIFERIWKDSLDHRCATTMEMVLGDDTLLLLPLLLGYSLCITIRALGARCGRRRGCRLSSGTWGFVRGGSMAFAAACGRVL